MQSLALLLAFGASSSEAQTHGAEGPEFQVNTYTTNLQYQPRVAIQPSGDFVVVWTSGSYSTDGIDGNYAGIALQRFDSGGAALGAEMQVNTYTTGRQNDPDLAVAANGDFVVVWDSYGSAGSDISAGSIQGRRFASDGTPRGAEMQLNDYTTDRQRQPSVGVDSAGGFVVVWEDLGFSFPFDGRDGSSAGVFGRRFASDGTPLGGGFQVNTYTTDTQYRAVVGVDSAGDFVVTWSYRNDTGGGSDVRAQRFSSTGMALGGEFQANTYTTGPQERSTVAVYPDGAFVIAWTGYSPGYPNTGIRARHYASGGTALGDDFLVSTHPFVSLNFPPAVGITPDGGFIVAWQSFRVDGPDVDDSSIQAQRHASDGSRLGGEFQVNTYTTSQQSVPSVATGPGGGSVIVWASEGSSGTDTDSLSVQGQRFAGLIFEDGFESGDTTAWSVASP